MQLEKFYIKSMEESIFAKENLPMGVAVMDVVSIILNSSLPSASLNYHIFHLCWPSAFLVSTLLNNNMASFFLFNLVSKLIHYFSGLFVEGHFSFFIRLG